MLIVLHGLPGVGKSTISKELEKITGGVVLGSNYIRRNIFGCDAYQCANVPLMPFSPTEILLSYRMMFYAASLVLSLGKSAILDATFQKKTYVEMAKEVAAKANTPCFIIKVVCDEKVCKERMDERERARISDSIVGYAHHLEVKEKIFEEYPQVDFVFDTSKDTVPQFEKLKEILSAKTA